MKNGLKFVSEEMHPEEDWYKRAHDMTMSQLMPFVREMVNDYHHDYGTAVHAVAASAVAAAWATCGKLGLTGFQANFVMWYFIRNWYYTKNETGLRIINFDDMLYPQYEYKFEKTINQDTWKAIQKKAQELIDKHRANHEGVHEDVLKHWRKIVKGEVPFGFIIKDDD